ncbi:response regulator transcription factor [uncultured Serinicoccus sp.]|uniref:response regulator n=1 Tax=uncultured Serinicoccus sp. TaxID=735514 RepID=UPI00261BA162|nr:response regulator transcription factor [uncultured Serinicoccus sp.]
MIRILVADDEPLVRAGLSALLSSEPDIDVVAAVADGVEAVERARTEHPDVVCLDIRMPRLDGVAATRELAGPDASPPIPVLILTTFDTDEHLFGALDAGASGFLLKDAEPDEVIAAVRSVAAGHGTIADGLTRRVIGELSGRRRTLPVTAARASDVLTPRETDILLLLAEGLSNEDIARTLVLEISTVKSHLARMMPKLGVTSRLQAVVWAYQTGLVTVGGTPDRPALHPKDEPPRFHP